MDDQNQAPLILWLGYDRPSPRHKWERFLTSTTLAHAQLVDKMWADHAKLGRESLIWAVNFRVTPINHLAIFKTKLSNPEMADLRRRYEIHPEASDPT